MADAAQEQASHADVDHGLRYITELLVVTHQPPPACHPAERPLDQPAARQHVEALLALQLAHDLDHEVAVDRLAHQLAAVVSSVREQVPEPWPTLANGLDDLLCAFGVLHVGGREVHHQEPPVGVHRHVPLAALHLLRRIIAAPPGAAGVLTLWLSITPADGLASRPAGSRSSISATSCRVRNNRRRTKRRNHQYTVCHGPKWIGSMRQPQPARAR